MPPKITVYSFRRCPFAMRVRMALHEKKIPFDVKEEDLKNFSHELKALHPEAKVPVLVHGSRVIYESAIITEYVDDLESSEPRLMLPDPGERAEIRLWTYWCNTVFKMDLDRFKYGKSRFLEEDCQGVEERLKNQLDKLEQKLKNSSWLVGNQFSLAEVHLFPFIRQLSRVQPFPSFLGQYKRVLQWKDSIDQRPSTQAALLK